MRDRLTNIYIELQTDRQTERDREVGKQTEIERERQKQKERDRQTYKQERKRDFYKDRQR